MKKAPVRLQNIVRFGRHCSLLATHASGGERTGGQSHRAAPNCSCAVLAGGIPPVAAYSHGALHKICRAGLGRRGKRAYRPPYRRLRLLRKENPHG